jgi:hypothetical protein
MVYSVTQWTLEKRRDTLARILHAHIAINYVTNDKWTRASPLIGRVMHMEITSI